MSERFMFSDGRQRFLNFIIKYAPKKVTAGKINTNELS